MAAAATEGKKGKKFEKSYFDVLGLCCTSEVPLVERILKNLHGVKDFSVIVPSRTVIVVHDSSQVSQSDIVKALNQGRLEASVRIQGVKNFEKKWPTPYSILCGLLLLLSFLKCVYQPFLWLAIAAVAIGIIPIVLKAITALRNFSFGDVKILLIIAVVGSIVLKDYWEAGTIVFLFTIAEWLESRASHKATTAMSSLVNLVPQRAILAETGEEVNVDEVKLNTLLAVKDGEVVPIDGVVVEGTCEMDEKTLTGESFPVPKQKDSTVLAGTINVNGYVSIRTTAMAEDSVVSRMTKLVEESQNNRSKTQRYIERCAQYYTPGIVIMSACLAIVPAALRVRNEKYWFHLALVVLVSACPCALVLSTPVAMFCALTKAATCGVFFKGAQYLEILAQVKIMAFDKTGTITRAEFEVTEFQALVDDIDTNTLLCWVSSIESKSSHPMAAALVNYAQVNSVEPKPDSVEEFKNFPGEGIYGKIDEKEVYIGNQKICSRSGCESVPQLERNFVEGKSIGYILLDSRPAGIFCLSDVCRTGAKEAVQQLKSMGIKTALLTGDSSAAANYAQVQIGGVLDEVHAELLPEDKMKWIKEFQKIAPTAMIGDGLNDAPALSVADVGISMGISGSSLASETGNVLLMTNDIQRIPKVAFLARRVRRKIFENIFLSIITKAAIVALAIAGHPLVWAAVLADTGTCLLVILNSMLLLRGVSGHRKISSTASPHKHKSKANGSCCSDGKPHTISVAQTYSSKNCATSCKSSNTSLDNKILHDTKHSCGNSKHGHGGHIHDHKHEHGQEHGHCGHDHKHRHHHEHGHCKEHGHDHEKKEINHASCSGDGYYNMAEEEKNIHGKVDATGKHEPKHCHGDNHNNHPSTATTDEEMGDVVADHCCQSLEPNTHHSHDEECGGKHDSDMDIIFRGDKHGGCRNRKCSNLDNRQIVGCCQSFMKECCAKNSHFGANFRGGLSEIVIE